MVRRKQSEKNKSSGLSGMKAGVWLDLASNLTLELGWIWLVLAIFQPLAGYGNFPAKFGWIVK